MKAQVFKVLTLGVLTALLAAGCATQPAAPVRGGMPEEMTAWLNQNQANIIYGTGISELPNESDALRQATMLAREDLAGKLETTVAAVASDAVRQAEGRGETERIARFEDATKQVISNTIRNTQTYGPFVNGRGNTYVFVYVDKGATEQSLLDYVDTAFQGTDQQLDRILGL
ncbi:MAG: hypothetical protein LBQ61_00945 [Spirochaetales bacterium]|nr:hypothetical protein [Spirochaetales bacterium]